MIEGDNAAGAVENDDQGAAHIQQAGRQVPLGHRVIAGQQGLIEAALHRVDIHERHQHPVDLVLGGLVRSHPKRVPVSVPALDLSFQQAALAAHFRDQAVQVGHVDIGPDIADWPAHIGGNQVQQRFRRGGEAPDSPVASHDDNRDAHADQQIAQVVRELAQFRVPVLQLLVQRRQFLVRGLQFLLGGLQFFVGALEFLVGREDLLVFHRQRLVGSFLVLDDGLQLLSGGSQFLSQIAEFVFLLGIARFRRFLRGSLLDQHEEIRPLRVAAFHRNDFQIDCLRSAVLAEKRIPSLRTGVSSFFAR